MVILKLNGAVLEFPFVLHLGPPSVYFHLTLMCILISDAVRALESAGLIQQVFPVHDAAALKKLSSLWVLSWKFKQPLDEIRRYFGVQIALYFAWLGHYTAALLIPSLVGVLVWLLLDPKVSSIAVVFFIDLDIRHTF